jgi:hypothetical protein
MLPMSLRRPDLATGSCAEEAETPEIAPDIQGSAKTQ